MPLMTRMYDQNLSGDCLRCDRVRDPRKRGAGEHVLVHSIATLERAPPAIGADPYACAVFDELIMWSEEVRARRTGDAPVPW